MVAVINDKSTTTVSLLEEVELLSSVRCKELEDKNKEMQRSYENLHQQLIQERKVFNDIACTFQLDMDRMKSTTIELEKQVFSLLQRSDLKTNAVIVDGKSQSEVELLRVMCSIWKKKYYELKEGREAIQDQEAASTSTNKNEGNAPAITRRSRTMDTPQENADTAITRRRSKSIKRISSLRNIVRGKSMPPRRMKGPSYNTSMDSNALRSADTPSSSSNSPPNASSRLFGRTA